MKDADVAIVGAGLAGLCCALRLTQEGKSFLLLEASDEVGGRVRTDELDGFLLDRGFQVLLTAYPEARQVLDYDALDLKNFYPGALIRRNERFVRVADPRRRLWDGVKSALGGVGTWGDKLRTLSWSKDVQRDTLEALYQREETTSLEALRKLGFSREIIEGFFRPWLGGIFLERELTTSSRMLAFVFRMFAEGDAAIPAKGMGAIPRQIAARLDPASIRTSTRVRAVSPQQVVLEDGETIEAGAVVVATDGHVAGTLVDGFEKPRFHGVTCVYFAADKSPIDEPTLMLDADCAGPINNLCVLSDVAPSYAPAGAALISASVLGTPEDRPHVLEHAVRSHLRAWFGQQIASWRHLKTYRIPYALPDQTAPALAQPQRPIRLENGLYVCGDHRDTASIQGAMVSGRRTADAVLSAPQVARAS